MSNYCNLIKISSQKLEEINKNRNSYNDDFWNKLTINYKLSEEFIEKNWNYFNRDDICNWQKLSEDFIRKHIDKLDLEIISMHQNLSINFIREFFDKLDSDSISWYQKLNKKFIKDFYEKLDLNDIKIRNLIEDFMSEDELESLIVLKKLMNNEKNQ